MRAEILEILHRPDFRKFVIITTAGVRYEITDPDLLAVAQSKLHYYFPKSDRAIHVPYSEIATVEELQSAKKR